MIEHLQTHPNHEGGDDNVDTSFVKKRQAQLENQQGDIEPNDIDRKEERIKLGRQFLRSTEGLGVNVSEHILEVMENLRTTQPEEYMQFEKDIIRIVAEREEEVIQTCKKYLHKQ